MLKSILLLVLALNVHLIAAQCQLEGCGDEYRTCIDNTGDQCGCYGRYLLCAYGLGCFANETEYQTAVQGCSDSGCTYASCTGVLNTPVSVPSVSQTPISSTPVHAPVSAPSSSCPSDAADFCRSTYQVCNEETNYNDSCACYGPYLRCLFFVKCFTLDQYEVAANSCTSSGCTYEQCYGEPNAPVSPSSVTPPPVVSPVSPPPSCNTDAATSCGNTYIACAMAGGNNVSAICQCYEPYIDCLYSSSCLNLPQYASIVNSCTAGGCPYQQCTGTVPTPAGPTPVTTTPTNSNPIQPPFSPPTSTVICLQPWELVLIVVGAALAGIGIAAIVGVIIYLSRRQLTAVKGAKYSKLQRQ